MRRLVSLSRANLKSFVRDRAALFWTLAFPVLFVVLFGTIFSGGGRPSYDIGFVDQDGTPAVAQLRAAFERSGFVTLHDGALDTEQAAMRKGDVAGVVVVPAGAGAAITAAQTGVAAHASLTLYTDPSRASTAQALAVITNAVATSTNLALAGRPPV